MSSGMKEIPLTQGKVALVDDEDYELVSQFKWYAQRCRHTFYAKTWLSREGGARASLMMHRLILGLTDRRIQADHVNGDGLDNRRSNLRPSTHAENARNCRLRSDNVSGFKGVSAHHGRWRAWISIGGRSTHVGYFDTPQEAARAYDVKARELHGEFARVNFP